MRKVSNEVIRLLAKTKLSNHFNDLRKMPSVTYRRQALLMQTEVECLLEDRNERLTLDY